MSQVEPQVFFRLAIVRSGQLRAPLFGEFHAPRDKVGPRVKQIIDKSRSDIDQGAYQACWCCEQRICKHDDKTAFPIELTYDENDRCVDLRGGACCERCSQLADYELWERITS